MVSITFDTNCLVDLELNEGAASQLRGVVTAHESGRISISVPGIGASERLKGGTLAQNFGLFQQRIRKLSKRDLEILKPPFYLGLAYFDWAILGSEKTIELERKVHDILFPEIGFNWSDHAKENGLDPNQAAEDGHREWLKWRNRKCDTLVLWCHIYYEKDVLVTRDGNFHKATKRSALEKLGAKSIRYPDDIIDV